MHTNVNELQRGRPACRQAKEGERWFGEEEGANAKGYLSRRGVYTSGVRGGERLHVGRRIHRQSEEDRALSLDVAVMPERSAHPVHVVLSVVCMSSTSGATGVVALDRARVGTSANADGAVEVGAEAGRAREDSADSDVAAYSSGVGDEGAVLTFSGGRASSA